MIGEVECRLTFHVPKKCKKKNGMTDRKNRINLQAVLMTLRIFHHPSSPSDPRCGIRERTNVHSLTFCVRLAIRVEVISHRNSDIFCLLRGDKCVNQFCDEVAETFSKFPWQLVLSKTHIVEDVTILYYYYI